MRGLQGILISLALISLALVALACRDPYPMEHEFLAGPVDTAHERLRRYSLEDQYKIFRYGNDRLEPPWSGLAMPIAERGVEALPFIMKQLDSDRSDLTLRDNLQILADMADMKTYDVKSDASVMTILESRILTVTTWQSSCQRLLRIIKEN